MTSSSGAARATARWLGLVDVFWQMARMALRNLRASRVKTFIVGSIVFLGAFLVVLGTSLLDSIDGSMKSSITGSVAGHVQIYNPQSKDDLLVMGDMNMEGPDLEPLATFDRVRAVVEPLDNVKAVVPMGIAGAIVTSGNTIDIELAHLRDLARGRPHGQAAAESNYQAKKAHVRQMVSVLAQDIENVRKLQRDGALGPAEFEAVERAASAAFWDGFDDQALDALEFLENRIAPLATDADMLFLRYVGTDPQLFEKAFSRMKIVDGANIPPGKRGFLFAKFTYEEQVKLKTARRLDKIRDAMKNRGARIATDAELQRFVRENSSQVREIVLQLDPEKTLLFQGKLKAELGGEGGDVAALLAAFFKTTDENFQRRYDFFYRELAPHLHLYRVRIGDTLTVKSFTRSGYVKSLNLPVYGTFAFEGLEKSPQAGFLNIMDLVSFRELYGFQSEAARAELDDLRVSAGAQAVGRHEAEDVLFGAGGDDRAGGAPAGGTSAEVGQIDVDALLAGAAAPMEAKRPDQPDFVPAELERGVALNAAVILHDDSRMPETMAAIEAAGRTAGIPLKAISWQTASGLIGQFVTLARLVLFVAVLIIFLVALVIINNSLVMATLERVQEFGTLRAIGAQRRFIMGMLLVESMVVGAIFGGLGVLAGAATVAFFGRIGIPAFNDVSAFFFSGPKLHPVFGTGNLMLALVIVFVVSLLSTLYPARLAMRVSPRQAMQSED